MMLWAGPSAFWLRKMSCLVCSASEKPLCHVPNMIDGTLGCWHLTVLSETRWGTSDRLCYVKETHWLYGSAAVRDAQPSDWKSSQFSVFVSQVLLSSETLIPNTIESHARLCKPHKHLDRSTDKQESTPLTVVWAFQKKKKNLMHLQFCTLSLRVSVPASLSLCKTQQTVMTVCLPSQRQ